MIFIRPSVNDHKSYALRVVADRDSICAAVFQTSFGARQSLAHQSNSRC